MASTIDAEKAANAEQNTDYAFDWRKYGQRREQSASEEPGLMLLISRIDRIIATLEKPRLAPEETLWSVEQIACWLGLSKQTVEMRVVTRPGFPAALRPVDSKQAQRRWFASDVMDWARSTAGTLPTSRPGRRRKPA